MGDSETRALERRAETGDEEAAKKALRERARGGDEEAAEKLEELETQARLRRPVSEWSVFEILDTRLSYGKTDEERTRYYELQDAKEALEDEIAAARTSARRGLAPDRAWSMTRMTIEDGQETVREDPRLVAWKKVAWDRLKASVRSLGGYGLPDDPPDYDGLVKIERALESGLAAISAMRKQLEAERGM